MLFMEYEGNKCNVIPLQPQLQGSQYPNHPQCQVEEHPSKTISIKFHKNFSLFP